MTPPPPTISKKTPCLGVNKWVVHTCPRQKRRLFCVFLWCNSNIRTVPLFVKNHSLVYLFIVKLICYFIWHFSLWSFISYWPDLLSIPSVSSSHSKLDFWSTRSIFIQGLSLYIFLESLTLLKLYSLFPYWHQSTSSTPPLNLLSIWFILLYVIQFLKP